MKSPDIFLAPSIRLEYEQGLVPPMGGLFKAAPYGCGYLLNLIKEMAGGKSATPAQIALAWVLAQKPWIVPIPGTRKLERLKENLGAADVVLATGELRDLNDALSRIEISGDRYPAEYAKSVGK